MFLFILCKTKELHGAIKDKPCSEYLSRHGKYPLGKAPAVLMIIVGVRCIIF